MQKGDIAPAFDLPASGGRRARSSDYAGRAYVLYFYPKADTPGCTKEAIAFQEALPALGDVAVLGVSRDPVPALDRFAAKYGLTFPLASDETGALTEAYGAWVEKSMYGKTYMGIERSTFLIDAGGRIGEAWPRVKVPGHVEAVLGAVQAR